MAQTIERKSSESTAVSSPKLEDAELIINLSQSHKQRTRLRERFVAGETIKSAQPSIAQREGKQVNQTTSLSKKSKKHIREDEASFLEIERIQSQEVEMVKPLKKHRRV